MFLITWTKKEQWIIFSVINGCILLVLLLFPLYRDYVMNLPTNKCGFVEYMHLYCPACGGTRAFMSLLKLDIISSFIYNPIVSVGAAFFVIYEFNMIKYLIKKCERPIFLKLWFVYGYLIMWAVYFILRNVLLFFGIDLIGDIIV